MTDAYVYDHVRSPRGRGRANGSLHEVTPVDLTSQVLGSLRDRNELDTSRLDDVVLGCVSPVGEQGSVIARTALLNADLVQAGLSIYWGLLGFTAMVWGARSARRWLWTVGAIMMGIVVAKLFLIDLGNSGTVERIVSFIGTGALLLVVGYFAPVPPRLTPTADELQTEQA